MSEPSEILNWRRIDAHVTTSGQPSAEQFALIPPTGAKAVINLAPRENSGAVENEAEFVEALGLRYFYIPVDFDAPSDENFTQFCQAMAECEGVSVHVHCIYNARVTAFMTRYIRDVSRGDLAAMKDIMDGIWRPGDVWAEFLGDLGNVDQPSRYKGYHY